MVRNPARPKLPASELRVTEPWSRPIDELLGERRSWETTPFVEIGGDPETLVVLAPHAGRLLFVDPDSGRTRAVVESWEGPRGRTEEPIGLAVLEERVFVGVRHGIEVFDLRGGHLDRIRFPVRDSLLDRALQMHRLDSASVLSLTQSGGMSAWRRFEADGERAQLPPPEAISRYYPEAGERRCWRVGAGSTGPLLANCFFPVVLALDSVGEVAREIVVEGGADSASDAQLDRLRRESRARWRAWNEELPPEGVEVRVERDLRLHAILDQYRGVRQDPVSGMISLLAETPEYLGGGEAAVRLFSREGAYLARVAFPEYWLHHDFRDSVLYAVTRDEDGRRWLRAYRLDLPRTDSEPAPGARSADRPARGGLGS